MACRLRWAPIARQDLRDLLAYIAADNPLAARRFVKSIFRLVHQLPDFPESGRVVPEFEDPTIRELVRRPCRVVYRIRAEHSMIEIARVWHARQGAPRM